MSDWSAVALTADLPAGTSAGVVLRGEEIVIWRDTGGAAHAWEDRCPHRGMKLSFGFVRRDRLVCLYHGWEYGGDGRCRLIPAHPDLAVPDTIRTAPWRIAETGGLIWVTQGDDAAPVVAPDADPLRSLFVDAPLTVVAGVLRRSGVTGGGLVAVDSQGPLWRIAEGDLTFTLALHEIGEANCALHILVSGAATPQARAALVPLTAALRDRIEAGQ